jgi:hypothetical protein
MKKKKDMQLKWYVFAFVVLLVIFIKKFWFLGPYSYGTYNF